MPLYRALAVRTRGKNNKNGLSVLRFGTRERWRNTCKNGSRVRTARNAGAEGYSTRGLTSMADADKATKASKAKKKTQAKQAAAIPAAAKTTTTKKAAAKKTAAKKTAVKKTPAGKPATKKAAAKPAPNPTAKAAKKTAARKKAPAKAAANPGIEATPTRIVSAEERYRMIQEAAYLRAEARHFAPGGEDDDWHAAEAEVDGRLAAEGAVVSG